MVLVEGSGVEWGEMLETKRSLSRESKQECQPRSRVSLWRGKGKRRKHFRRGFIRGFLLREARWREMRNPGSYEGWNH